jgi:hypothetical protein
MTALELYYEAEYLMKSHGSRADLYCAVQARRAVGLGNLMQFDHWERLGAVVRLIMDQKEKAAA